jgi:hypothetical protein
VLRLAQISDSHILVSSRNNRTTRFWETETSRELVRLRGGSHRIAASADGRLLFTGDQVGEIESPKPLKLGPRGREFKGPGGTRWSFFTPDSR